VDEDNAEDTEVITVWVKAGWLEDDGDVEGEYGEEADDVMETGVDKMVVGGVLAVFIDKSTGSVCIWKWSTGNESSGGSPFTLFRNRNNFHIGVVVDIWSLWREKWSTYLSF
jgi:hypothetical protein